jgi:hypothetical protein
MSGIILRAYTPMGYHPANGLRDKDASLIIDEDLVYSAARFTPVVVEDDPYYYVECEWLKREEIRLLSAIAISVPEDGGKVFFYPYNAGRTIQDVGYDLSDPDILKDLKDYLISSLSVADQYRPGDFLLKRWQSCREKEGIEDAEISEESQESDDPFVELHRLSRLSYPAPPLFGGPKYLPSDLVLDTMRQKQLFDGIVIDDHLLIRGLGAFLKADILHVHSMFHTEGCISLHIAMEATLQLILRKLRKTISNPSNKDASRYIGEIFNSAYPEHYFQQYYEDRIKTIHPANRFGTFPEAPLQADDFYDLYDPLRAIFHFLITGNVK